MLPLQRVPMDEAILILRKARDHGINFFDTARWYSDSEEKIGKAFAKGHDSLFIATKTGAKNGAGLLG